MSYIPHSITPYASDVTLGGIASFFKKKRAKEMN